MKLLEKLKLTKGGGLSLGRSRKTSLSVYASPEVMRLLELASDRKPTFEPVEELWHDRSEDEKLHTLRRYVYEKGLKGKKAHTVIPARSGILKIQRFPASLPKKDLNEAIKTFVEVEKANIKEESVHDYFMWEDDEGRFRIVALVLVRKSTFDKLKELIEGAGLELGIVDYEITAIVNGGLYFNLKKPFAVLYIDFHESVLVYYTGQSIVYNLLNFTLKDYLQTKDDFYLEDLLVEVRNILTVNEINAVHLAGKAIEHQELLEILMTNLPILSLLEPEHVRPSFFIPYTLCLRGLEEG
ncbi:MAG: pilus assembly protein PilM [Aquificae bacterium]|nr:pilus assembly protein PilM [Aquificota bacterium]